jgi:fructokinase
MDSVRRLPRTSSATATATATIQADGSAHYEFAIAWDPPDSAAPPVGVVRAGSLGLFVEPGSSNVRRRLEAATGSPLVTLDPNIRLSLPPGRAAVLTHYDELLALADVVKFSDDDAAWLYPELSEREVSRRVLDQGPALVVITRGVHGSCWRPERRSSSSPWRRPTWSTRSERATRSWAH